MKAALVKIKPLCLIAVLALMTWGLYILRDKLQHALLNANWLLLSIAIGIAFIYLILNASVWGLILRLVGTKPKRTHAAQVWIESEAMRWLPGGIWGYASRVVEAQKLGITKANAALSLVIELSITIAAWAALGLIGILFSPRLREVGLTYLEQIKVPPTAFIITLSAIAIISLIIFLSNTLQIRSKILDATTQLRQSLMNWKVSLRAFTEYLLLSLFYSAGFLLCIQAIGINPSPSLLESAGSYGIAWIVGLFAFGAPGGMGVREGFLYLVFQPLGIGPQIATAAILWRAIQILTEIITLIIIKLTKKYTTT